MTITYVYTATLLDKHNKEWPISLTIDASNFANDAEFIPYAANDIMIRAGGFKRVVKWEMKKIEKFLSWEDKEYAKTKDEEQEKKWNPVVVQEKNNDI